MIPHPEASSIKIKNVLFIYGSGGMGKEIVDLATRINNISGRETWGSIFFIDDYRTEDFFYNINVLNFENAILLNNSTNAECIIAVGEPRTRRKLFNKCKEGNLRMANLIDPSAIVSSSAIFGTGIIACSNAFVSSECIIGDNVLLQPNSSIGHDTIIGRNSVISTFASIAGECKIGEGTFIGMVTSVKEKISIGNESIIGMGSAVFKDIPDGMIALGNPARIVKQNENLCVFK